MDEDQLELKPPKEIAGWKTISFGIVLASIFSAITWYLMPSEIGEFPRTNISGAIVVFALTLFPGFKNIPVASVGVPLFLGKRLTSFFLAEGWQWVGPFPFIFSIQDPPTDFKERTQKLDPLNVFTKDKVKVKVEGAIGWQVKNPSEYLSVAASVIEIGLDDAADEVIRREIAGNNLDDVLGSEPDLRDKILDGVREKAQDRHWGIKITRVFMPEFGLDPKVEEDLALKRREEAQREGERTELDHIREQIKKTIDDRKCSFDEAKEIVLLATKRIGKQVEEKRFSIDDKTAEILEKGKGLINIVIGQGGGR